MQTITRQLAHGAIGGLFGTLPMTLFMRAAQLALPAHERYPLPPERITAKAAKTAGLRPNPHRAGWEAKTYLGHFGYGAAVGMIYALVRDRTSTRSSVLTRAPLNGHGQVLTSGAAFGLLVWIASYLGWLPAVGMHRPATQEPFRRNALMITAHLIWGAATALVLRDLRRQ